MKRPAIAAVLTSVAVAVAVLTACDSNAGVAASVGGHEITDRQLDSYVAGVAPGASAGAQSTDSPRSLALGQLVQEKIFEQALAATDGGLPSAAALVASHDAALALFGETNSGPDYDAVLLKSVQQFGLADKFSQVVLRSLELEYTYIQRSGVASPPALAAAIGKLSIPVTVSGRYGTWDPKALTVNTGSSAGAPSFVQLPGIPSPSASPAS